MLAIDARDALLDDNLDAGPEPFGSAIGVVTTLVVLVFGTFFFHTYFVARQT